MRTALLAGTPTTSVTVTALTGATECCSSRAGETDRVCISARLRHSPRVVSWQQPWAVLSRHFAVIRVTPVIREDRELVAKLAQLTTATAPLAMCIMDRIATAAHQQNSALRFSAPGKRFQRRPNRMRGASGAGEVLTTGLRTLPHSAP